MFWSLNSLILFVRYSGITEWEWVLKRNFFWFYYCNMFNLWLFFRLGLKIWSKILISSDDFPLALSKVGKTSLLRLRGWLFLFWWGLHSKVRSTRKLFIIWSFSACLIRTISMKIDSNLLTIMLTWGHLRIAFLHNSWIIENLLGNRGLESSKTL